MITKDQALYVDRRYGITLPTWLDAQGMDTATAALTRAVCAGLRRAMQMRTGLRVLLRQHAEDVASARALLESGVEIEEDFPARMSVADALKAIADLEQTLGPVIQALHEATNETHL